jgi:hypothetical protein
MIARDHLGTAILMRSKETTLTHLTASWPPTETKTVHRLGGKLL